MIVRRKGTGGTVQNTKTGRKSDRITYEESTIIECSNHTTPKTCTSYSLEHRTLTDEQCANVCDYFTREGGETIRLSMEGIDASVVGWKHLLGCLRKNKSITRVDLLHSAIHHDVLCDLSEVLSRDDCNINMLIMRGIDIISQPNDDTLLEAISLNKSIRHVGFSHAPISQQAYIGYLLDAIGENEGIISVDVSGGTIRTHEDVLQLQKFIWDNDHVKRLNMSHSKIGIESYDVYPEIVGPKSYLTSINLSGNNLGNGVTVSLMKALETNKYISYVNISNNKIKTLGCVAIVGVMEVNSVISSIILHDNPLGWKDWLILEYAVGRSTTVVDLGEVSGRDKMFTDVTNGMVRSELCKKCAYIAKVEAKLQLNRDKISKEHVQETKLDRLVSDAHLNKIIH